MQRLERDAVIAELVSALREQGSWCGETHVQKAMYFLQEMAGVPTGFSFVLYKHGPFSFDLRDEITSMRADRLLEFEILSPEYGPSLKPSARGRTHLEAFREPAAQAGDAIDFVAQRFGDRNVAELERLGTALYVRRKHEQDDVDTLAREIVKLKPHVTLPQAREAVETVARWQAEAESVGLAR